jgi:antitoxin component of RelBE/YafQ-DinJ toxin-antitoxin module
MKQETTEANRAITESIRIDKDLMEKIRYIAKSKGMTLSGYININLSKIVNRQWLKVSNTRKSEKSNL